jgi:two-component system, sensor histidine kinase and response regulator
MSEPLAAPRARVLVVEDNDINAILARRLLEKIGCNVTCVGSGQHALELLEESAFDAVLMDVQMPGMDGIETTRRIRARERERGGHVPICALTAHIRSASEDDCMTAGMDAYQLKPFDLQALRALIARLVPPPAPTAAELAARFGGDMSIVTEVAALFLQRSPALVAKVAQAMREGPPGALERAAHMLKGALLTLGAAPAAEAAAAIESGARSSARVEDHFGALEREIQRLRAHLAPIAEQGGAS